MNPQVDFGKSALMLSLQVAAQASLYTKLQMERQHLFTSTVIDATNDFKQLCLIHLNFLRNQLYNPGLQPVLESQEEYNNRKSSLYSPLLKNRQFKSLEHSLDIYVQPVTAIQKNKYQQPQYFSVHQSTKSVETLSQQLSQIKIDKQQDILMSEKIDRELDNVDPSIELSQIKDEHYIREFSDIQQDQKKKQQQKYRKFEKNNQFSQAKSNWYEDADISYQITSHSDDFSVENSHNFYWDEEQEDDDDSEEFSIMDFQKQIIDIQPEIIENQNENSLPFLIKTSESQIKIDHNTPKKKRLYCNNKKIPVWAQDLSIVQQKCGQQKQDPAHLFGILSQKAVDQAFLLSNSKQAENSMKWKKQKEILNNQIQNLNSKSKESYRKLKKYQQNSSQKFNDYRQNFLFGQQVRKNFLNLFPKDTQSITK
ncbi:unnamed protein product [Paramecium primaurelia]|uniref:Uncharacterized protein n=1 Tax=Paramecium primaurelia TaxID=5886 RepID=A0A8S1PHL4_PARPR|nr:unnamed protein product [Paramecium primaurelia]